ncbi:uncharacterized protein L3040_006267 [Drepanopeziza brunnea f. sp. 'multigermtubi']|uniref:2EXR domain-containing protein n=1 Tax=Marssonina brunnea f. sp. multigermtubi (strain MB_m1) TaxID=1072389 RepID=K1WWB4_MARBU|nr:uncharacterized protein MBM_05236 [Drepanopeziza brunnea f. sp. 'multigermtubi' MB_m1]EKD16767.1 hypothetical protein MBM_05236 [Drepanopeziza brunnea f. sp. 'multigermtubi' MB_m1]KAJ5040618.1 hypothetical protein L3040_006267 [Drepanopeziza brunnea f. sp. 'multigermtubi']
MHPSRNESSASSSQKCSKADLLAKQSPSFGGLPPEVRDMIWVLAMPEPQVLRMSVPKLHVGHENFTEDVGESLYAFHKSIYSTSSPCIPLILHINHESRAVGLKYLRLNFPNAEAGPLPQSCRAPGSTFWSPDVDTIYLPTYSLPENEPVEATGDLRVNSSVHVWWDHSFTGHSFHHSALEDMQHLALPWSTKIAGGFGVRHDIWHQRFLGWGGDWMAPWLYGFPSLKSVTFIYEPRLGWYRHGKILLRDVSDDQLEMGGCPDCELPLAHMIGKSPTDLKKVIAARLEQEFHDRKAPDVEMKNVVYGERRTSPFCIRRRIARSERYDTPSRTAFALRALGL